MGGVLGETASDELREKISNWLKQEPRIHTIILEIDSPGTEKGRLEPAEELAGFLSSLKGVRTIARILQDKIAGNGSALLALSSKDLVMSPGARLGSWQPSPDSPRVEVPDGEEKEAEKARRLFKEFSTLRPGPSGRSHLAAAMISRFHPPIYKVRFEVNAGNDVGEEIRFLTPEEIENLDPLDKQRKRSDAIVLPSGQKLTLDLKKAVEYGFAVPVGSDEIHELLHKLNLPVGDENIIDMDRGGVLKPSSPPVQTLIDFINHPLVRFLLLLLGTLGFLLEIKMPGTLVPSITSIVCYAIFFMAGLYPSSGGIATTSVYEILLFVIGLALMGVELILMPGVLLFGLSGAAVCLLAIVLAMVPPSGTSGDYRDALTTLIASSGTAALLFFLAIRYLPRSPLFEKSGIVIYSAIQGTPTGDSVIEAQTRDAALLGKTGIALTSLRPAGVADVEGSRIDVVAEGDFIEKGEKVQIIEMDGTRTVVKKA